MNQLIREINNIIGNYEGSQLTIRFYNDSTIVFGIYEQELPIVIDKNNKSAYLDCETINDHLTPDMIKELSEITQLIEENIDIILSCF